MGTNFSNPKNQTHKHMIPIIHPNTQTQTHKHVHPHNKSKKFFSKYKQNPEVINEREERGGEEWWNQSCMSFPTFFISAAGSWWRRLAPLLLVEGDLASWVPVEINARWSGDRRWVDFLCWRLALFGLDKVEISVVWTQWEEENGGAERGLYDVSGYWGKKKGIYGERKDTCGYGNREPDMVLREWVP